MGNLEKAGVLVVVALLAVILVVAFLNFPDQGSRKPPVLGAAVGKLDLQPEPPKPPPMNVPPSSIILPGGRDARKPSSPPPVELDPPEIIFPAPPSNDDKADAEPPARTPPPATEPERGPGKPVERNPSGYPKLVKVQRGDTLWAIAVREYGAKVGPRMLGSIADANPRVRPEALRAGTEISLPAPPSDGAETPATKPKAEAPPKKSAGKAGEAAPKPAPARRLPFVPSGS
jgi:nucleoid-associated protein YgaU